MFTNPVASYRWFGLLSSLLAGSALANGTPIDQSGIEATGGIRLVRQSTIALEKESLHIVIDGDDALVRAEYQLVNGGAPQTVTYGFPVDHTNPAWCNDCEYSENREPLRDASIEADGTALATRLVAEPPTPADVPPNPSLRTWIVTDLEFDANQRSQVTVSYRARNWLNDWAWSTDFLPAFSERRMRYLLSPSGNWGDGKVGQLIISLDVSRLKAAGGQIRKLEPSGYTQSNGILRWQFTNFDLSQAADLELTYDDGARLQSKFVAENRLRASTIRAVTASSTLATPNEPGRHDVAKLLDGDPDTAWCEGTAGASIGESITFEFYGVSLWRIGVLNGYPRSEAIYAANGRVRRFRIETVPEHHSTVSNTDLERRPFERLNRNAVGSFIDWLADTDLESQRITRLTLTIDDVYAGDRHEDTCIAEIYLLGGQ